MEPATDSRRLWPLWRQDKDWMAREALPGNRVRLERVVLFIFWSCADCRCLADTSHVPCKFFRQGTCQAGKACPFSHDLASTTDNICKYFSKVCSNLHLCNTSAYTVRVIASSDTNAPMYMFFQTVDGYPVVVCPTVVVDI
jgi:hypothetical protein